ncbi:MAG: 30S ribosomal protein S17e [Candidatus Hydrothermarchaeota archaeon]
MGRIRQKYIKRTAFALTKAHADKFTSDFKRNREVICTLLDIQGKFVKNKIAGYVTHILKRKK